MCLCVFDVFVCFCMLCVFDGQIFDFVYVDEFQLEFDVIGLMFEVGMVCMFCVGCFVLFVYMDGQCVWNFQ